MTEKLWRDYLFLTKEMMKFLDKQDFDLFYEIMEQREKLQRMIESATDDGFRSSKEGKEMIETICGENRAVALKLEYLSNTAKRQHDVSRVYDSFSVYPVGGHMDRQT